MKALLVIDIQKSYITKYENAIVQRINERIIKSQKAQYDIIYKEYEETSQRNGNR